MLVRVICWLLIYLSQLGDMGEGEALKGREEQEVVEAWMNEGKVDQIMSEDTCLSTNKLSDSNLMIDRSQKDDPPERGQWSNPCDFFISCLGYAVGLGMIIEISMNCLTCSPFREYLEVSFPVFQAWWRVISYSLLCDAVFSGSPRVFIGGTD